MSEWTPAAGQLVECISDAGFDVIGRWRVVHDVTTESIWDIGLVFIEEPDLAENSEYYKLILPACTLADAWNALKAAGWAMSKKAARWQLETVDLRITPDGVLTVFPQVDERGRAHNAGTAANYEARTRDLQREGAIREWLAGVTLPRRSNAMIEAKDYCVSLDMAQRPELHEAMAAAGWQWQGTGWICCVDSDGPELCADRCPPSGYWVMHSFGELWCAAVVLRSALPANNYIEMAIHPHYHIIRWQIEDGAGLDTVHHTISPHDPDALAEMVIALRTTTKEQRNDAT